MEEGKILLLILLDPSCAPFLAERESKGERDSDREITRACLAVNLACRILLRSCWFCGGFFLHARRKKLGAEEEMSYAAFKMVHSPTGVEHCAAAYLTHTAGHLDTTDIASFGPLEFGYWGGGGVSATPKEGGGGGSGSGGLPPNLVVAKANLLEVYHVRVLLEGDERTSSGGGSSNNNGSGASSVATAGAIHGTLGKTEVVAARGSSLPAAVSSVKLELACSYRFGFRKSPSRKV